MKAGPIFLGGYLKKKCPECGAELDVKTEQAEAAVLEMSIRCASFGGTVEQENQNQTVAIPEPAKPKRKYRKRRKRGKKARLLSILPQLKSQPDSLDSTSVSEPEPAPGQPSEKFEQACDEVLAGAGAEPQANRITTAEPEEGVPNPEFEKMAKVYLSKPFKLLAFLLEDDDIKLTPEQEEILVPEAALSLEEIWPYLPEWFKNSRFKHTYAFVLSFGLVAGENCVRVYRRVKALKDEQPKPDPHVPASSTLTADSPASSGTLLNRGGVKLT
jgi:hypothetical protein